MKLYVNGDSHTAAAEAVNQHAFAEDDQRFIHMGRAPHPENSAVSWARQLGDVLKATVHNDAESASSNDRIMRTTRDWLRENRRWWPETLVVIQWSTWERAEWLIDGTWYQINASGQDHVPEHRRKEYRNWITQIDWGVCTQRWHGEIWRLHQWMSQHGIRHVFFNGNNHFGQIPSDQRHDWGRNYIGAYDAAQTYDQWLKSNGFRTVSPESWHFGRDAHAAWANFMLQYVIDNQFMV